ncbi:MAG: PD-(D/E)XK nuclease family protein [Planctomycetota bacterium]|jgi:RecB family exonuclease
MPLQLTIIRGFGGLTEALAEEVSAWRPASGEAGLYPGGWVILPSRPLLHAFQDAVARARPGALNVRVASLDQLARCFEDPAAAGRPVPWGRWDRFIEEKLKWMEKSPLYPALELNGLRDAIFRTVHDLRMTGSPEFGNRLLKRKKPVFHNVPKVSGIASIYNAWAKLLREEGFQDRADLYRSGVERLEGARPARDLLEADRILTLLPPRLHGLQREFLTALGRTGVDLKLWAVEAPGVTIPHQQAVIEAFCEESAEVVEADLPALSGIEPFGPGAAKAVKPRSDLVTLNAPGPEAECREAARECLRLAEESIPFNETAILLRHPSEYLPLLTGALSRSGIPFCYRGANLVGSVPEARGLLALLEGAADGFARATVFSGLRTLAPDGSHWTGDGPIPVDLWDRITREAGQSRGLDAILAGLDELAKEARESSDEGKRARGATRLDAPSIEACRKGLAGLFDDLVALASAPNWREAGTGLVGLASRLFKGSPERAVLLHALASLADLDLGGPSIDADSLFKEVHDLLEGGSVSSGRVGRGGVNLLPVDQAAGLTFRAVIVPGMALKRFPAPLREDPILLDEERTALCAEKGFATLMTSAERLGEEAYHFTAAVAGASEELVLTFPGYDPASGRAQVASAFLLRVHEAVEGRRFDLETLMSERAETVPVFTGFNERSPAATVQSFDRTILAALDEKGRRSFLSKSSPAFARIASRDSALRKETAFSPFDGWVKGEEALATVRKRFGKSPGFSPTGLEEFATCPYRFLLKRVVRLSPLPDPAETEDEEEIDRATKGTLVHEVLEHFFGWLKERLSGGEPPSHEECREALAARAGQVFGAAEAAGEVGAPAVWEVEKAELMDEMWTVVAHDLARIDEFRPLDFERELVMDIPLPGKDGASISLLGYADRIDLSPDGRAVRVIDYKVTGGRVKKEEESFMGGTALQLPLYMLYALSEVEGPDMERTGGVYYFLSRMDGFTRIPFTGARWKEKRGTLLKILRTIYDSIRSGIFPLNPGEWNKFWKYFTHCGFCDFEPVCTKGRRNRSLRLLEEPPRSPAQLRRYAEMLDVETRWS